MCEVKKNYYSFSRVKSSIVKPSHSGEKKNVGHDHWDKQTTDESINSMFHDWEIEIDVTDKIKLHKKNSPLLGQG